MIETFFASIAFGTFWFWLIAIITNIIIIHYIKDEEYPVPSILIILLGVIYWKQIITFSWPIIAIGVGIYALVGAGWSICQWYKKVQTIISSYNERYDNVLSTDQAHWLQYEISVEPNRGRITGWIAFWPWDMSWTIAGNFFNSIYELLVNVYRNISNNAFKKVTISNSKDESISRDTYNSKKHF